MTAILTRQRLVIDRTGQKFAPLEIAIDPLTALISVRIKRSTTLAPVAFGSADRMRVSIIVNLDGNEEFRCDGQVTGGIRQTRRMGEMGEYSLSYMLPWGFFGATEGLPKRLGERAETFYRGRIEVVSLAGTIDSEIEVSSIEAEAPRTPFHRSVAFDAGSGDLEQGGDATVSFTHAGGAGSDRAAFMVAGTDWTGSTTAITNTYAANAASGNIFDVDGPIAPNQQLKADYLVESVVPTGNQTASSVTTGTGSIYLQGLSVITMTGVHQTVTVGTPATATGSGATPSVTSGDAGADDIVVEGTFGYIDTAAPAAGANQTAAFSEWHAASLGFMVSSYQDGADGGVMTRGAVNHEFVIGCVAFKPSDGAAAGQPYQKRLGGVPGMGIVQPGFTHTW